MGLKSAMADEGRKPCRDLSGVLRVSVRDPGEGVGEGGAPLVSELGTTSRKTTRKGVEYLEIQYEGIVISGDMPVSLFREITAQVAQRAGSDNPVERIRNYLSLPRDWDPEYVRQWEVLGDIGVDIKEYPMGSPRERTRCTYRFYYRDAQFVMSDAVRCLHWD